MLKDKLKRRNKEELGEESQRKDELFAELQRLEALKGTGGSPRWRMGCKNEICLELANVIFREEIAFDKS